MRIRSRSLTQNVSGLRKYQYDRVYDNNVFPPTSSVILQGVVDKSITERADSISDVIQARPEVYVDPKSLKWRRFRYPSEKTYSLYGASRLFGEARSFRPVKPCVHTKTVTKAPNGSSQYMLSASGHQSIWTNTYTRSWSNPWIMAANLLNYSPTNLDNMFNSISPSYSVGGFKKNDWFALTQDFQQACDSFCKSQFLAGEAMYESEIFVSAFKLIVNPSSAISTLAKFIRTGLSSHNKKKYRRMNLGQFSKHTKGLSKKGVDAHLSYDFAVKPAIDDVISTLSAHDYVSRRMSFLSQNSGSYIPIRVKQQLAADHVNAPPGPLGSGSSSTMYKLLDSKTSTAHISAWGRVRKDLDWNDTWSAYLQYFGVNKAVGLAWELIPFSFVLDWVTDAQEYIDKYTRLRTGGPFMGIKNVCASLKEQTIEDFYLLPGKDLSLSSMLSPSSPIYIAQRVQSTYSRNTSIPETSGLVDFSNLGSFHYTKLAELVFQFFV